MRGPGSGAVRVTRGLVLSGLCVIMSMTAHVAAGGALHLTPGLTVGALALSGLCVAAADTRRSFGGILGVVLISQLGLHLFAGAGAHPSDAAIGGDPVMAGGPVMISAHLVAAVVVSTALAAGERLIWAVWGLARIPRVPRLCRPTPRAETPLLARLIRPATPALVDLCSSGLATRAPPG